jgi:aerobic-type carbon monoxide dehydrogenase small subunit (CoxS/CutS family)
VLVRFTLNGAPVEVTISDRDVLADTLRDKCGLTALHLGCEHGSCGACTINLDGKPVRCCLVLTAGCDGRIVTTLEGLSDDPCMQIIKRNFHQYHALQCGFCTPGMLMTARDLVQRYDMLNESEIRHYLAGQICRCTGYVGIVAAILNSHREYHSGSQSPPAKPSVAAPQALTSR